MGRDGHGHGSRRATVRRGAVGLVSALLVAVPLAQVPAGPAVGVAGATTGPVAMAAPYEYLGWGSPQPPTTVMAATGLHDFTLAFILAHKGCTPEWDGKRPLLGGTDAAAIAAIRAAGGDVDVSIGGWSGKKLGAACKTVPALTAAYQQVVDAYGLSAIDVDIEHGEVKKKVRERVIAALAALQSANPDLEISITFGSAEDGPGTAGQAMITQAASLGFQPYAWTIMPFDFGAPVADMGATSIAAAEGVGAAVATAYHETASEAYAHLGISSMNGDTDESDETVSLADFSAIESFATANHLARLTFWSVNRDRSCAAGQSSSDSCSGISQTPYAFTSMVAAYTG